MLKIEKHLQNITNSIIDIGYNHSNFGVHGMGGEIFLFEKNLLEDLFSPTIFCENAFLWKESTPLSNFCTGKAGVNWIFTYMLKKQLLVYKTLIIRQQKRS